MKNLIVERDQGNQLHLGEDAVVASFTVNAAESRLYVVTLDGVVTCYSYGDGLAAVWRCPLSPELLDGEELEASCCESGSWVVDFAYVLELDALCIATRGGKIALLHVAEGQAQEVELVGSIDGGLVSLEWSPDGELLVALSGVGNLLVMNQAWELMHEGPAWGAPVDPSLLADSLFQDGRVTWRGDGKFFAVVCRDPTASPATPTPTNAAGSTAGEGAASGGPTQATLPPYCVRIWDRGTLELHATGEPAADLLPLPAWQPNGRHLYVAASGQLADGQGGPGGESEQVEGGCQSVLLYERNGLRHGGFSLISAGAVHSLAWSCDSELLAVLIGPSSPHGDGASVGSPHGWIVQLWHRTNWHWYLKHERGYATGVGPAAAALPPVLRWDEQQGGVLHVVAPGGLYERVTFAWDVCRSDRGTVAVVDGRLLLLTPLRHGLVPPPMCAARVALPEAAVSVSLGALPAPGTSTSGAAAEEGEEVDEVVAALTSSGRLVFSRSVEEDLWEEALEDQEALAGTAPSSSPASSPAALLPAVPPLDIPMAGGRRTRAVCWLHGSSAVLVLAAPYPDPGLEDGPGDVLVQVDVEWASWGPADPTDPRVSPEVRLAERPPVYAGARVVGIAPHAGGGAAVQLAGGGVSWFRPGAAGLVSCGPGAALPVACPLMRSTPRLALELWKDAPPLLGLSRSGMLCWGSTVLAAGEVTSLAVRAAGPGGPALLYTTRKNLLYTVLFSQLASYSHKDLTADPRSLRLRMREGEVQAAMHAAMRPDAATAAARDVGVRAVEAGAVLVGCPAGADPGRLADVPAVLQMPRGNLEGVAPRALVLAALVGALRRADFGEAWRLAGVQRVDLNMMVDYAWPAFLSHSREFTAAVSRPTDLCDLLFALRPGSVLAEGGAYAGALEWLGELAEQRPLATTTAGIAGAAATGAAQGPAQGAGSEGASGSDSKVAAVCRAVREAVLAGPDPHRYLEVVVTSYARSDPPQLEEALRCIRDAKERELAPPAAAQQQQQQPSDPLATSTSTTPAAAGGAPRPGGGHSGPADKALKHLLLYVDADELYRTALGMYDMPLAYMVVVNTQKDPGEYLAELQRFAAISPAPLQRHAVDMSLRRYASALIHLVQAGPQHFEQALQLAKDRGLLRQMLQLYDEESEHRPRILDAYGDQLEAVKRYEDAAVSYLAARRLDKALKAYRAAGRWRMVFVVAGQLEYDEGAVQELAAELAEELAAGGQAADAAAVLLSYLGDVDNAVRTYTQAREWREATRVAHCHFRGDLLETVVAPAAAEAAAGLLTEARESAERLRKYGQRLKDVRARRLALMAAVAAADEDGGAAGGGQGADDLQSDVVSLVSGLSVYTDATAAGAGPGGGALSASASASSRAPSTLGGRKAHRQGKKLQKAGARIRQGSPLEEASLVAHVHGLAPRPSSLEEAGQLGELLVLLGHGADARTLQRALAAWQEAYQEVRADVAARPVPVDGPPHARAEMERLLTPAPDTSGVAWKWDVLRDFAGREFTGEGAKM